MSNLSDYLPCKPLATGGTIGVFAPSSPAEPQKLERGIHYLESLGFNVVSSESCKQNLHYICGTGEERSAHLMEMVNDDKIDAIFCMRGGFGALMMLPFLDYERIAQKRKIIAGFSDVTALQWAIWTKTRLISFSAGMVATDMARQPLNGDFTKKFWTLLQNGHCSYELLLQPDSGKSNFPKEKSLQGYALPGTLSVACMLQGSQFLPNPKNSIAIFEDVDEPRHKYEAYLQQFRLSGFLHKLNAAAIGCFSPALEEQYPSIPPLNTIFQRAFEGCNYPVFEGLRYGHVDDKICLPVGAPISVSYQDQIVLTTSQPLFQL
ncbi:MAG: LD-carboxypeptidase [Balneolales bacterium]|nr:LD-carboxypeptidase [Balneolales bacterium]